MMEVANKEKPIFKKPLLIGKVGKFPTKLKVAPKNIPEAEIIEDATEAKAPDIEIEQVVKDDNVGSAVTYVEPPWSGIPASSDRYVLEVLKNGIIIERIDLVEKSFWMFGRFTSCHICMQHPTISRYHAVLQYKHLENDTTNNGFYIYDLESTHGTFLNKNRIRARSYMRIRVGHMLKLGCSTRAFLLNGPPEDTEAESPLSVTELYQKKNERIELKECEKSRNCDWGLSSEEADEETDLSENPYAQTNNEDLYIEDPKKALRGFFEREGLELEYDCNEQGIGQFLCKVELPIDDEMGRPIFAEVVHKGKKKEAVVQCALEACRILDRHGILRQAVHESKKRKPKNWEENDFYDSDEDTFLDRTGTIEKKREFRMKAKVSKAETYDSLLIKEKDFSKRLQQLQKELLECQKKIATQQENSSTNIDIDTLDSYMIELKQNNVKKQDVTKLKSEIFKLKQNYDEVLKLLKIVKPALVIESSSKFMETPLSKPVKKVKSEDISGIKESDKISTEKLQETSDKKRRKNQKRLQQRQEKAEINKQKGYAEDANKEDYNMWVPPVNQTGDGRTLLNEKYGY